MPKFPQPSFPKTYPKTYVRRECEGSKGRLARQASRCELGETKVEPLEIITRALDLHGRQVREDTARRSHPRLFFRTYRVEDRR
ncbi:hypothetical protein PUNSTDRAFT_121003, partial [Punctularia strigosozonata HHB-11173 SS5]|uniref:uncharacterized protein n=1 Tax=Punctularia strigosozonata (strain HHB-11173) TaxID=741275 RepID=UPI0004416D41